MFEPRSMSRLQQPKVFNSPRDKKKTVWPKYLKIILISLIGLIVLIYFFYFSPFFKIKNIEVIGPTTEDIQTPLSYLKGRNIFLVNSKNIKKQITENRPEYANILVLRGLPSTLRIKFQERAGKIVWQSNGIYYLVDKDAIAFKEASFDEKLPLVIDSKNLEVKVPSIVAPSNFIEFIRNAASQSKDLGLNIVNFVVNETTFQVDALTEENLKIKFDTTRPLSDQIDALKRVYFEHKSAIKEYIDVRVEGWVYYK